MSRRVCILLMDSLGIGASEDAIRYGDQGADTFGHIVQHAGPLALPELSKVGLYHAAALSTGHERVPLNHIVLEGAFGYAVETSLGKDTPSGHWELAGVPVDFEWGYFNQFPEALIEALIKEAALPGVLGLTHASGTEIIQKYGEMHCLTQKPIIYTSADSVFQIAAHEDAFGLERLYDLCVIARRLVDPYRIGRVIARPFMGEAGHYYRTPHRKDYAIPPHKPTVLDHLKQAGREVICIGKTADIFAHQGVTQEIKAHSNEALFEKTMEIMQTAPAGSLVFTNFVDFDSVYGHRRDLFGYAKALEAFDRKLAKFRQQLRPGDLVLISADHGCDPTFPGSDHTREHVPVLCFGPEVHPNVLGRRETLSDMGQTIAEYLGLPQVFEGRSFLDQL